MPAPSVVAAIDQGTTSTRCFLFDHKAKPVASAQIEHMQRFPQPGWVEHDAAEIWSNTRTVITEALASSRLSPRDIAAFGITNQRETTVVWDRATGEAIAPALVWQDTRTRVLCDALGSVDRYRAQTGLPVATYFSGTKLRWLLDHVSDARRRAEAGELAFGTVDSWLLWNLSGGTGGAGPASGTHATDPTNASRTMLMDLETLAWSEDIAADLGVPTAVLPEIRPSSGVFATVSGLGELDGIPIAGVLGDQQAALLGQACLLPGEAKNTYGTGNFLLLNTGATRVPSSNGLITTVAYSQPGHAPVYALEGSIAVTGALVQWLRDNLGVIDSASDIEALAASVPDTGGAYFVPAFSGLFAPHWRPDARGVITGLTRYVTKAHLARAALEAVAFQTHEIVEAMRADVDAVGGIGTQALRELKTDGGMVGNDLLMQIQADLLGTPVIRPVVTQTTALGAAYAAGLAVGFWTSTEEIRACWAEGARWEPHLGKDERERRYTRWRMAVQRALDWE